MHKYTNSELLAIAKFMVNEDAKGIRDQGTCVLGAGIMTTHGRFHRHTGVTIPSPFQGNVAGHKASQRAIKFLNENGVPAIWYDGVMD